MHEQQTQPTKRIFCQKKLHKRKKKTKNKKTQKKLLFNLCALTTNKKITHFNTININKPAMKQININSSKIYIFYRQIESLPLLLHI